LSCAAAWSGASAAAIRTAQISRTPNVSTADSILAWR
jgi:hypothetical protein